MTVVWEVGALLVLVVVASLPVVRVKRSLRDVPDQVRRFL